MWTRLRAWIARIGGHMVRAVHTVASWVRGYAHSVAERHRDRMSSDTSYRSALIHASTAGATVLFVQPAIAAAIGVLVSEHVRPRLTRPTTFAGGHRRLWDSDWDDPDTDVAEEDWPQYRP